MNDTKTSFDDTVVGGQGGYYSHRQSSSSSLGTGASSSRASQIKSPLDKHLTDLRRKHAATAGTMMNMMEFDMFPISGVVGLANENDIDVEEMVRKQDDSKSTFSYNSSFRTSRANSISAITSPEKPRKQIHSKSKTGSTSVSQSTLSHFNLSYQNSSFNRYRIGTAPHAENLLHSTPQLQHMISSSTDMGGPSSRGNILSTIRLNLSEKNDSSKSSNSINTNFIHQNLVHKHYRQVSHELSSFVRLLANEMSLEEFASVENQVFTTIFSLVHSPDSSNRLAGVIALDEMISVDASADEEKKAIKFANNLSSALRQSGDYAFLAAVTAALGRMAMGASNVDYVEFEVTRALEWLRMDRPDRRLAACLTLKELARNAPTSFYSKTSYSVTNGNSSVTAGRGSGSNEFIDCIFPVLRDPQPIVRACAADALSECMQILIKRQHRSTTGTLCQIYKEMMDGFSTSLKKVGIGNVGGGNNNESPPSSSIMSSTSDYSQHGSLLVMREMMAHTRDFMLPRFDEACHAVLSLFNHPKPLIRLEIIRLIPHLARRCPGVYGRKFLDKSLEFLLVSARNSPPPRTSIDVRPSVFLAIGQLSLAMKDESSIGMIPMSLTSEVSLSKKCPSDTDFSYNSDNLENGDHSPFQSLSQQILQSKRGIYARLNEIFELVQLGLRSKMSTIGVNIKDVDCVSEALHCGADLVEALGETAEKYVVDLVDGMFESGLSEDLIRSLSCIVSRLPSIQSYIENRLLQEISLCLAGTQFAYAKSDPFPAQDIVIPSQYRDSNTSKSSSLNRSMSQMKIESPNGRKQSIGIDTNLPLSTLFDPFDNIALEPANHSPIKINLGCAPDTVSKIVLSLKTVGTIGSGKQHISSNRSHSTLLPFVHDVVAQYLSHPAVEVRMEAALACCKLLIEQPQHESQQHREVSSTDESLKSVMDYNDSSDPSSIQISKGTSTLFTRNQFSGSTSGKLIEEGIDTLLRVPVSDPSSIVRLCVVRGFDTRYDMYLCQTHHLPPLFLLLQDEALAVRAAALQLLGRLAQYNPAPILPPLRRFLMELISELRCGSDTVGGRECATRLLVVFLRAEALQRLVHPFLPAIISALPVKGLAPRLASAALEALGELSQVSRSAMNPWVRQIIPLILSIMQDQSSATKQRISLRTLGQIAGGTGYVIAPYIEYPELLPLAADVLPGTKRAPWSLRREVIRTFGILGALDPNRYHLVAHKVRKGGGVGVGYFIEMEDEEGQDISTVSRRGSSMARKISISSDSKKTGGLKLDGMKLESKKNGQNSIIGMGLRNDSNISSSSLETRANRYNPDSDDNEPAHLYMYEQYAMTAQPVSKLSPARRLMPTSEDFYPTVAVQALTRILKDPSLAVHHGMVMQAVMFIFNALGLRCVPFLKRIVPHILNTVQTCGQSSLREALLQQVASLSGIVRDHLRPYVPLIFEVVEEFWNSRHLATVLLLIEKMSAQRDDFRTYVPRLVRLLLASLEAPRVSGWGSGSSTQDDIDSSTSEADRLELVLRSLHGLKGIVREYFHLLVPALVKLADSLINVNTNSSGNIEVSRLSKERLKKLTVLTIQTLSILLKCTTDKLIAKDVPVQGCFLPAQAAQPLMRMIGRESDNDTTIGLAIVEALCVCARQLEFARWIPLYHTSARDAISAWQDRVELNPDNIPNNYSAVLNGNTHTNQEVPLRGLRLYDETIKDMIDAQQQARSGFRMIAPNPHQPFSKEVSRLGFSSGELNQNDSFLGQRLDSSTDTSLLGSAQSSSIQSISNQPNKLRVNQANLQRAWDVSQRANREDWDEWMRRLSVELLREAPNPALRATAGLAHAYQPLSRELFSAAFCCCWAGLNEQYRSNLVRSLEIAFKADSISPEILQTLLNLCEFMEHDFIDGGLPIDIPVLAELALKCRAYAKALHYKEREYNLGGSSGCVEDLISINKKLDLPEAALGVLKAAQFKLDLNGVPSRNNLYYSYVGSGMQETFHSADYVKNVPDERERSGVEVKESWLSKLGSWSEALAMYSRKVEECPSDVDAILGCMRCLDARGEYRRVLDLAKKSWAVLSGEDEIISGQGDLSDNKKKIEKSYPNQMFTDTRTHRRAIRFCAQAAWRLSQWDELEVYSSQLARGNDISIKNSSTLGGVSGIGGSSDGSLSLVDFDGAFYSAVLHIHRREWSLAADAIDAARKSMDGRFTALMAESYKRAYPSMVTAQTLAEMEEIISYRKLEERAKTGSHRHAANSVNAKDARRRLLEIWRRRLAECRVDAEVHSSILAVRSLILGPLDEVDATLTLSALSRQAKYYRMAENVLLDPLSELKADLNGPVFGFGMSPSLGLGLKFNHSEDNTNYGNLGAGIDRLVTGEDGSFLPQYGRIHEEYSHRVVYEAGGLERMNIQHKLYYAYIKHLWAMDHRDEAIDRLSRLSDIVDLTAHCERNQNSDLRVACWLKLGNWNIELTNTPGSPLPESLQAEVLTAYKRATAAKGNEYKAWHAWALINFRLSHQLNDKIIAHRGETHITNPGGTRQRHIKFSKKSLGHHVVAAVQGFSRAISLGTKRWSASVQQDMLNLLTCLFKFGELPEVASTINDGLGSIMIEAWLGVLPQLLARIHIKSRSVRSVLHPLLERLGAKHPQALMYPLSVLLKSPVLDRKVAAETLMNSLKAHSNSLVEEALLVSSELIRVAILWLELWHEGLEDASRLYFGEGNVSGMLDVLFPLHEQLEKGPTTRREQDFERSFGADLKKAHGYVKDYVRITTSNGGIIPTEGGFFPGNTQDTNSRNPISRSQQNAEAEAALNQAWDLYYTVFRRINKQLPGLTTLELSQCSPALKRAHNLELGVPGTYRVDGSYVKIESFIPNVQVITSKQRPRKIVLRGSDGKDYMFLLKGHEDLRQDERVMQLFGLVNALLAKDRRTNNYDLNIQRYAIAPLSHNAGVVGWVPHCDTLHSLIRDYREPKKIPLNMENREMMKMSPDYDLLTVMQKVEVFESALQRTTGKGNDLYEVLWIKSSNSEEWLERRTKYTRSLAVMSMVGYILGLGDRHPSNLMLDQISGDVVHIDFGDCFEVAMNREKYPEKIPFRLTRMLINAMEVSGIEGNYRSTCERTMGVLRDNRDSLVAMLEAFVYDPLISWRLLGQASNDNNGNVKSGVASMVSTDTMRGERPTPHSSNNRTDRFARLTGVPSRADVDLVDRGGMSVHEPIREGQDEDGDDEDEGLIERNGDSRSVDMVRVTHDHDVSDENVEEDANNTTDQTSYNKSLRMYSEIQSMAANLSSSSRIASITGGQTERGSLARSRLDSVRQRGLMSFLEDDTPANEEALNERALKVVRRVQDKLTGTDFAESDGTSEPLDVQDQVQRLIVQATSSENLCQLFIGWCAFW